MEGILSQEPAEEWFRGYTEVVQRTEKAMACAADTIAYAENVLAHLYLIRERLAMIETHAAELAARTRSE